MARAAAKAAAKATAKAALLAVAVSGKAILLGRRGVETVEVPQPPLDGQQESLQAAMPPMIGRPAALPPVAFGAIIVQPLASRLAAMTREVMVGTRLINGIQALGKVAEEEGITLPRSKATRAEEEEEDITLHRSGGTVGVGLEKGQRHPHPHSQRRPHSQRVRRLSHTTWKCQIAISTTAASRRR